MRGVRGGLLGDFLCTQIQAWGLGAAPAGGEVAGEIAGRGCTGGGGNRWLCGGGSQLWKAGGEETWRGDTASHKAAGLEILGSQSSNPEAVGGDEQLLLWGGRQQAWAFPIPLNPVSSPHCAIGSSWDRNVPLYRLD